jgi:hypothetical protein
MMNEIVQFLAKYFGTEGIESLKRAIKKYEENTKAQTGTPRKEEVGKRSR